MDDISGLIIPILIGTLIVSFFFYIVYYSSSEDITKSNQGNRNYNTNLSSIPNSYIAEIAKYKQELNNLCKNRFELHKEHNEWLMNDIYEELKWIREYREISDKYEALLITIKNHNNAIINSHNNSINNQAGYIKKAYDNKDLQEYWPEPLKIVYYHGDNPLYNGKFAKVISVDVISKTCIIKFDYKNSNSVDILVVPFSDITT